jgi:hypothetical protein
MRTTQRVGTTTASLSSMVLVNARGASAASRCANTTAKLSYVVAASSPVLSARALTHSPPALRPCGVRVPGLDRCTRSCRSVLSVRAHWCVGVARARLAHRCCSLPFRALALTRARQGCCDEWSVSRATTLSSASERQPTPVHRVGGGSGGDRGWGSDCDGGGSGRRRYESETGGVGFRRGRLAS